VAGVASESGCVSKVSDRDGDGISDDLDKCPNEPEDKDGFQDQDGCPDLDNDGDGVPDATDNCALAPEDKDGFEDADGCPDPDNDGDGVADGADKCPNLPETFNGFEDADGCPDNNDKDLVLTAKAIELKKPVAFAAYSDKIRPESLDILDRLAKLLVAHTYLTKVAIESHTDSEGTDEANLALTQKRAEAVVDYLVSNGVARERLVAKGLGESRPLVPNDRPARRAQNRRVEVYILETR
jgi:outer membrane protein OmpA-like peptidoglycan-associated protein